MKYQDIQISDVELLKSFVNHWLEGEYQLALEILNNPQLDSKKFASAGFNLIGRSLIIIESYYQQQFTDALRVQLYKFDEAINNFIYKREWEPNTNYKLGNFVSQNNKIYLCAVANYGEPVTNSAYWKLLDLIGDNGEYGIGKSYEYKWDRSRSYLVGEIVLYQNYLWYCIEPTTSNEPIEGSQYWSKFLKLPKCKIITSVNPPLDPYDGLIWNKILVKE